jgi:dTDP-4-amino-4,6-dideoxygalactose transaminase
LANEFLPFARPEISEDEIAAVVEALRSGWLTYGPRTQALEQEFAALAGAEHAVAVTSCTAAMHLALLAAGIGPGDEVITTPITFAATANVIVHAGARPVLADVCADDLNLDPAAAEAKVTPRTKAIMPVHYGGQACRMDELLEIAQRYGLRVIEDAAHAAGARYRGRPIGSLGDATAFSFYATKNMTTGEGGMLTTNDAELAEKGRLLRAHGLSSDAWKRYTASGSAFYEVATPGFNYRMTDFQAALGRVQLARLPELNTARARIVARYSRAFEKLEALETPRARPDVDHVWHLYALRLRLERLALTRDEFVDELRQRGIGTSVHFIPVHYHAYYREGFGFSKGDFPVAEDAYERLVSLPLFPSMTDGDVDRVIAAVEEIVEQHGA